MHGAPDGLTLNPTSTWLVVPLLGFKVMMVGVNSSGGVSSQTRPQLAASSSSRRGRNLELV